MCICVYVYTCVYEWDEEGRMVTRKGGQRERESERERKREVPNEGAETDTVGGAV